MKRTIWILALSGIVATAAHAAISSALLPAPLFISTVTPHIVLTNSEDPTEISMALPDTIVASRTQRLSKDITYNNTCTLDKDGKPTFEKTTTPYPRVAATVTRVSTNELLVEWKTRQLDKLNTYTMDACTIEAPLWNVKEHSQRMLMNDASMTIDGWNLELSTQLPGIGDRP